MNRKGIIYLLVFLLICWIAWISYSYSVKTDIDNQENIEKPKKISAVKPVFSLSDGNSFYITNKNNVKFSVENDKMIVPDELSSDFAKLSEFLNNNPEKTLVISGLYNVNEIEKLKLAEKRALKFKKFLMSNFGVDTGKIMTTSKMTTQIFVENDFEIGPLSYVIETEEEDSTSAETNKITETIIEGNDEAIVISNSSDFESKIDSNVLALSKKRQTYYYPPNFDYISISRDLDKYFEAMEIYFSYNRQGLMEIRGYNDSEGDKEEIKKEGLKKAKLMTEYILENYDIAAENIKIRGSSRQVPQTDNVTKAQNRKIVFKIIP